MKKLRTELHIRKIILCFFRVCTGKRTIKMNSNRSESITIRCQLHQPDDHCFIEGYSQLTGFTALYVRHHYPDLYHNIRQKPTRGSFTDNDIIVCKKHFRQYIDRNPSVPRSHTPPAHGNYTFIVRYFSKKK
jgi:hypothetical protein